MKTFEAFLFEGVADKVGSMSDDQFNQFMKGRTDQEAKTYRDAREKSRGKDKKKLDQDKAGALALRKKEDEKSQDKTTPKATTTGGKTAGLGAKDKGKESFNRQRAASGPAGGVRTPLVYNSGKEEEKKRKEEEKKRKEKDKGKNRIGKAALGTAKFLAKKAVDGAVGVANTNTKVNVPTYAAQ